MAVHGIKWVKRLGGGVPDVVIYKEADSQTFKEGQPVVYDASEDGVKLAVVSVNKIMGFALADAAGTNGLLVPVLVVTPDDVFTATISNAGADNAAGHDTNNIGLVYDWIASTVSGQTAKITIDENAAGGSDWFKIIDIYVDGLEPAGTAGGRMYFTVMPGNLGLGGVA